MKIRDPTGAIFYSNGVEGDITFTNDTQHSFYNLEDVFILRKGFAIVLEDEA